MSLKKIARKNVDSIILALSHRWYCWFKEAGVFLEEHIRLHNKRCVTVYANFTRLLNRRNTRLWAMFDSIFDSHIPSRLKQHPEKVVFVGVGSGAHFANALADHWARRYIRDDNQTFECFAYAERDPLTDYFVFGRHQSEIVKGKIVIVVDDVLVSGATLSRLCTLVIASDGTIEKCLVLLNRSRKRRERLPVGKRRIRLDALCHHYIPSFTTKRCPMCRKKIDWSKETSRGLQAFHLGEQPSR